jgi:hypothetical protein
VARVWLLLSAVTLVSAALGATDGFEPSELVTAGVLVIAAVKARFILRDFMDVRAAPAWLRYGTDAWLTVLLAACLILYPR